MGLLAGVSVLSVVEVFYHFAHECNKRKSKVHPESQLNNVRRVVNEYHALYQLSMFFAEFVKISDMHGIRFTNDSSHTRCGRIFWTVLVILSIATCSFLVIDMYMHAEKSPVAVRIDPELWTLDEVRQLV